MSTQTTPFLTIDRVSKRFGRSVVVDEVSLDVRKGEFLTLLGPSGCGKTTTLRLLAGFEKLDRGSVTLDGRRIDHLPPNKRPFAMVFQNYALFPHLSVFGNVAFGLKLRKLDEQEIASKVRQTLELVGLAGLDERFPKQLSGGQQQRIALARALVVEPNVLLLDEPLSNLDVKLRAEMRRELKRIQRTIGVTTVYVTHDQQEAFELSDRIAVMYLGRLVQIGTPLELFRKPKSKFAAEILGDANFIEGVVTKLSRYTLVLRTPAGVPVDVSVQDTGANVNVGQTVVAFIRPRGLILQRENVGDANSQEGIVEGVVPLGEETRYFISTRLGSLKVLVPSPYVQYQIGERVHIGWKPADLLVINSTDDQAETPQTSNMINE